ncbi:MAG: sigma-70 family RNA polymerase sigma factor [Gemmataceae bacterium]
MTAHARAVLGHVIRTAHATLTDRELLRRYAAEGDEAAFAALVQRHTGMVLGVCRRVLPTVQDAEDACQATFLVLARKAASTRWQPSVANWLHATARHVADRARMAAGRRAKREAKAAGDAVRLADRTTGRDLLAALDEELARLPAIYREPLVLCYLEGLTRDEAAARLRIPAGTVKIRLERGRKKLGDALTARGVGGSVALAQAATSQPAASARLVEAVLATVSGDVPPAVAALAQGAVNKSLWAAIALAVAVTVGIGIGVGRSPVGQPPAKPQAVGEPAKEMTVAGRVLDPGGKPVAEAALVSLHVGYTPVDVGRTDADGRFRVTVPPPWYRSTTHTLLARADGFGADVAIVPVADPTPPVEFRLTKDCPVRGRLLDTQGKPAAGVRVSAADWRAFAKPSLDDFLAAWLKRHETHTLPDPAKHLQFMTAEASPWATTTDADGRFTIAGLGADRPTRLLLNGGGIATADAAVIPRPGFDPKPYNATSQPKRSDKATSGLMMGRHHDETLFHGPDLTVVVEAEKPIHGTVIAADTGKPRAGAVVSMYRPVYLTTRTDADGRFALHGVRKASSYTLTILSDADAGFLMHTVEFPDTIGYEPVRADIASPRGVIVTGRLIDGGTGQGVEGHVGVDTLTVNPFVKGRTDAERVSLETIKGTARDGTFRIVAVPGPVILMAAPSADRLRYKRVASDPKFPDYFPKDRPGHYYMPGGGSRSFSDAACKVLVLEPGTKVVTQDLVMEPARAAAIRIQDAAGNPLVGAYAAPATPHRSDEDMDVAGPSRTDVCSVYEVSPAKPRLVTIVEPKRKLAGKLLVRGDEAEPPVVRLQPTATVTGRLRHPDGKPVLGQQVRAMYTEAVANRLQLKVQDDLPVQVPTDADGRFRIVGVFPGESFHIHLHGHGAAYRGKPYTAGPGATMDIGDFTLPADG